MIIALALFLGFILSMFMASEEYKSQKWIEVRDALKMGLLFYVVGGGVYFYNLVDQKQCDKSLITCINLCQGQGESNCGCRKQHQECLDDHLTTLGDICTLCYYPFYCLRTL